jgi:glycerol transport system permease protein
MPRINWVMTLYLVFLMLPIYWLLNMSIKTNTEILNTFTLWPETLTLDNYRTILGDPAWYMGYVNSIIYVTRCCRWPSRCLRPMRSAATISWATSTCSSGC